MGVATAAQGTIITMDIIMMPAGTMAVDTGAMQVAAVIIDALMGDSVRSRLSQVPFRNPQVRE
jgi:hypothetical protein